MSQLKHTADDVTLEARLGADVSPVERCRCMQPSEPCAFVIFGASGDLTSRKIIPALYTLFASGSLPENFIVLGCARSEFSNEAFRVKMREALAGSGAELQHWDAFSHRLHYSPLEYGSGQDYQRLAGVLQDLQRQCGASGNRLLYLAVPPGLYEPIVRGIGSANLSYTSGCTSCWSRIVIEKPFGRDLDSSRALNRLLGQWFDESRIFRIDHYLAKETVQNILVFRFANAMFEPVWNRQYIAAVDILAAERVGVEHRAGYYDQAGVLRDMFQNHMMQLLALTAMEPPARFEPVMVRDEKAKLFRCLRPVGPESVVLGQYTGGSVDGAVVPGYREEPGVDPRSCTPTYCRMNLQVDNWRWQGVPFRLVSGKRLARKHTAITVHFRDVPHALFRDVLAGGITANRLTFTIQPDEKIALTFQAKTPSVGFCLRSINMEFSYDGSGGRVYDAYEKVLLDCMVGDQMLFLRQDSEDLCWSFLTSLIRDCETCTSSGGMLRFYPAGTWGPEQGRGVRQMRRRPET